MGSMCLLFAIMRPKVQVTIDEEFVTSNSKQVETKMPWSSFKTAKEERRYFWFEGARGNLFIPKRAFVNQEAMINFRTLVASKMGERPSFG